MLKKIALIIAIIIALPLLIALFVKSNYAIEREISIDLNKPAVFSYLKYLKNQNNFSKWANIDPEMKKEYRGIDGTVGFVSAWDSTNEDVGKGEQEIINIVDGKRIDFELRFLAPFESTSPAYMTTEDTGNNTTLVKWGFKGHMDYPMNLMFLFMDFEQIIGADLQTGLDNLKVVLENETKNNQSVL